MRLKYIESVACISKKTKFLDMSILIKTWHLVALDLIVKIDTATGNDT